MLGLRGTGLRRASSLRNAGGARISDLVGVPVRRLSSAAASAASAAPAATAAASSAAPPAAPTRPAEPRISELVNRIGDSLPHQAILEKFVHHNPLVSPFECCLAFAVFHVDWVFRST